MNAEQTQIHERAVLISKNFKRIEIELIDILELASQKKVFLAAGFQSLFEYAVSLGLSPSNAYAYTKIAKISQVIPELKAEIKKGNLSITNAKRILPAITKENKKELIQKATSLSSRALEKEMAASHPEPIRESVRPVSEDRLRLNLGISEEVFQKLKRAQALLSNQRRKPASFEEVLETALNDFLDRKDPVQKSERAEQKAKISKELVARLKSPVSDQEIPKGMVHVAKRTPIPAQIKHQVFRRDHAQCQFKTPSGKACGSEYFIDLHHKIPVSNGGTNEVQNLTTLCRTHHQYLHEHYS